jgi:hypothetical protein
MLRALVVVLLLANALALAAAFGMLDGLLGRRAAADREPERLQRQVRPELVTLLPPAAASAALAAASAASSTPSGAASAAVAALCLEAGPLPAAALAGAEKSLLAAGVPAGSWSTVAAERKGLYLIYMGRYEDEETLQRKLEEVRRRRIEVQPVRNADLQPGIEVGRFDDKAEAEAVLARLAQRGLRTARVLTLAAPQPQLILRLAAADPSQAEALAGLKLAPGVGGFAACAPAGSAVAPAATSSATSSAPPAATPTASAPVVATLPAAPAAATAVAASRGAAPRPRPRAPAAASAAASQP